MHTHSPNCHYNPRYFQYIKSMKAVKAHSMMVRHTFVQLTPGVLVDAETHKPVGPMDKVELTHIAMRMSYS